MVSEMLIFRVPVFHMLVDDVLEPKISEAVFLKIKWPVDFQLGLKLTSQPGPLGLCGGLGIQE